MYFATIRNIVAESSRFETVLRLEPTQSFFFAKIKTHTNKLIFLERN